MDEPFKCPKCDYGTKQIANLLKHGKNYHELDLSGRYKPKFCPVCNRKFYINFENHLKKHKQRYDIKIESKKKCTDEKNNFQSLTNDRTTIPNSSVLRNLLSVGKTENNELIKNNKTLIKVLCSEDRSFDGGKNDPISIENCKNNLNSDSDPNDSESDDFEGIETDHSSKSSSSNQLVKSSSSDLFNCPECDLVFKRKYHLQVHSLGLHGYDLSVEYVCKICQLKFYRKPKYVKHVKAHKKEKFPKESKEKSDDNNFDQKVLQKNSDEKVPQNNVDSEDRFYVCKVCGYGFKRIYHLKRHSINIHKKDLSVEYLKTPYNCCNETFFIEKEYSNHVNIKHEKIFNNKSPKNFEYFKFSLSKHLGNNKTDISKNSGNVTPEDTMKNFVIDEPEQNDDNNNDINAGSSLETVERN